MVRIAKGLWDQWGPRMQSILEQTVKTLHEANEHPATADDEQLTILDALTLLADDKFKNGVLTRVSAPYLLQWRGRDFKGWRGETKADALAPVQTRLSYYSSSKRARAILGQPRSTIDMRRVVQDGGILLVSTAQGAVGKDVASLVGASLLNLVDAVIREQGSHPPKASGAARWWGTPLRGPSGRSASPTTCSGATTSTSPAPAWASPPSCTILSRTRCGRRRRAGTRTPSWS